LICSVMGASTEAEGRRELTQHGVLHVHSCGWRRGVRGGHGLYSDGTVLPVLARLLSCDILAIPAAGGGTVYY
jgi:hypothetical protein